MITDDVDGWFASGWQLEHKVHGTFFIGRWQTTGSYHASRVFADAAGENGLGCETIEGECPTLVAMKAAVAKRIAELDAAAPVVCTRGGEQLEACR